jgi:DNA-binding MarR family transcriptional regulator
MPINKMQLNDDERKVLRTLARRGTMSPSRVSAETLLLPGQTLKLLKELADVGMVLLRDDPANADGQLVAITSQARDLLAKEL